METVQRLRRLLLRPGEERAPLVSAVYSEKYELFDEVLATINRQLTSTLSGTEVGCALARVSGGRTVNTERLDMVGEKKSCFSREELGTCFLCVVQNRCRQILGFACNGKEAGHRWRDACRLGLPHTA